MLLKALRLITLVLAALSLTMESAHVLELPQKLSYDPQTYTLVNGSLYKYFAAVGGAYQIGAIAMAFLLALAVRHRRGAFAWTLSGALLLLGAFVAWLLVVAPVNGEIDAAWQAQPDAVPMLWTRLRNRWEYGHAAGFVIQLFGFAALLMSIIVEAPRFVHQVSAGSG
jgi:hypothetical protein